MKNNACIHFNECGGCSKQYLTDSEYYTHKQNILTKCITSLGVSESVMAPLVKIGKQSRRKVELQIATRKGNILLGFFKEKTHDVFDMYECLVTKDNLVALTMACKPYLNNLKKASHIKSLSLTTLDNTLDVTITLKKPLSTSDQQTLIALATEHHIARLNLKHQDEVSTIFEQHDVKIKLGNYNITLPPDAFLQATQKGQDAISNFVLSHLHGCNNVADLYCGVGTYSFPLLEQTRQVFAYEGHHEMVAAMHNAITHNQLEAKLHVSVRDLFKQPLPTKRLNQFDGLVINPPRSGALPQIKHISRSTVPKVVMVSCNPTTFKRDAKQLIDSGYCLTHAMAIDQFYWSNHLEVVATFKRNTSRS